VYSYRDVDDLEKFPAQIFRVGVALAVVEVVVVVVVVVVAVEVLDVLEDPNVHVKFR